MRKGPELSPSNRQRRQIRTSDQPPARSTQAALETTASPPPSKSVVCCPPTDFDPFRPARLARGFGQHRREVMKALYTWRRVRRVFERISRLGSVTMSEEGSSWKLLAAPRVAHQHRVEVFNSLMRPPDQEGHALVRRGALPHFRERRNGTKAFCLRAPPAERLAGYAAIRMVGLYLPLPLGQGDGHVPLHSLCERLLRRRLIMRSVLCSC